MMNTTGTMVVQVLSGPTRQMLRRSIPWEGFNLILNFHLFQQTAYQPERRAFLRRLPHIRARAALRSRS